MNKPAWVRRSGPYRCVSLSNGHILLKPSWSQCGHVWNAEEGGGPSFSERMALAGYLEMWLNSAYSTAYVEMGFDRIDQHDLELEKEVKDA